jgi:ABC-type multidrug transport system fused ATPase/permease subunit
LSDEGLLPSAWRLRETVWGGLLAGAARQLKALAANAPAQAALLLIGMIAALVRIAARARVRRLADELAIRVASSLRLQLHRQTLRLGPSDLQGERREQAQQLFTRDVDQVRDGLSDWLTAFWRNVPALLLLAITALLVHWRLFYICVIPLVGCWWIVAFERRQGLARREQADARADAALRLLSDSLRKSRLVRGYAMESFEHERFQKHLEQFQAETALGRRMQFWSLRLARISVAALVAFMLFFVGQKVLANVDRISTAGAFLLLSTFVAATPSVGEMLGINGARQKVDTAGGLVANYVNEIPEVGQAVGAKFLEPLSKTIIYESITYRRGDREVLKQFDLRLPAGQTIALVSLDALQPRAAAYLLPRFIEPQNGRVLYDSEDIAWATLESLRAETVYVGGADPCFNGTVLENITCGESRYAMAEATDAAKLVHAHKFILKLPLGYETPLGERGERLDAGQAFLLGLARAALRKPALLVIEEPDTVLDDSTKDLLDDSYQRIADGRTVIFLPTRLSTVRKCDLIVLLAEGKVAAMGTHADLLKTSELYRHWEYMSFNTFRRRSPS